MCARRQRARARADHHPSPLLKICPAIGTAGGEVCFPLTIFLIGRNHMFAKYITAGLVGSALLATVAFAQSPTATSDRATAAPAAASDSSFQGNWRASKLVGLSVYNDNNESVGAINDLLTEKDGKIKAVVIGVGGFLGIGEHLVAIPYEKVKFVNEPVVYSGAAGGPGPPGNRPAPSPPTGAPRTTTVPPPMPPSTPPPRHP